MRKVLTDRIVLVAKIPKKMQIKDTRGYMTSSEIV
jgi:hypothetical protein